MTALARIEHDVEAFDEPRLGRSVSLDHAAALLGVSRRTIYNRIRDGRLQTVRTIGGSQRVLIQSVFGSARLTGSPVRTVPAPKPETGF